jgi:hypothetical protein
MSNDHRYQRKIDCSRRISLQKINVNKRASSGHIDKTKQTGRVKGQFTKTRQAGWVNEPTKTANILLEVTFAKIQVICTINQSSLCDFNGND